MSAGRSGTDAYPSAKGRLLFRASWHGQAVTVGHASRTEIAAVGLPTADYPIRDAVDRWSIVAIRNPEEVVARLHLLGWRAALRNTWITSPLLAVDAVDGLAATASGHAYRLGSRDAPALTPKLRAHLAYALRTWGFEDVR